MLKEIPKKNTKLIKIFDLQNEKILWNGRLCPGKPQIQELMGQMISGLYTLCEGHLYFNNKVIKIRYDLLNKKSIQDLKDEEVFDYYDNVLNLDKGDQVKTKMPVQMVAYHRLAYITTNQQTLSPNVIWILPYLHERKVFFSNMNAMS